MSPRHLQPALIAFGMLLASTATAAFIDLHAHPFMDDGLGTLFHGKFEGELRATDWRANLYSQINIESLEKSNLGLVVVSLYAHPIASNGRRDSIRRQLARAHAFVKTHPHWIIATSPLEARRARANGKGVLVLALEGASGILETEEDLREFVDEQGLRIVTFLHLTDDHLGGAAFFRSFRGFIMSPISWFLQMFSPTVDEYDAKLNRNGLTADGADLARRLIKRKVWLDLAHASDKAQAGLLPLLAGHQPLLYTHTVLRKYLHSERGITEAQLEQVKKTSGIVGLMPSEEMLEGTPASCADGIHELAAQFAIVAQHIGAASTQIGSDFNGGINHLMPPKCATGTALDAQGLWNIGQSGQLWLTLKALGVPWPQATTAADDEFIATFLAAWSKVTGT